MHSTRVVRMHNNSSMQVPYTERLTIDFDARTDETAQKLTHSGILTLDFSADHRGLHGLDCEMIAQLYSEKQKIMPRLMYLSS